MSLSYITSIVPGFNGLLVFPLPENKQTSDSYTLVKSASFVATGDIIKIKTSLLSTFVKNELPETKTALEASQKLLYAALARITELELELAASYAESSTTRGELTSAEEQIEELGTKLADAEEKIEQLETFSEEEYPFEPEYPEELQMELPLLSTCTCYCHSSETKAPCELCFSEKCYMHVPFFEPVIELVPELEFWACINISTDYALAEDSQHVPIDSEIIYDTFSSYGICVDVVVSSQPGTFFIKVKFQEEIDRLISRFNNMLLGFDPETIMHISAW